MTIKLKKIEQELVNYMQWTLEHRGTTQIDVNADGRIKRSLAKQQAALSLVEKGVAKLVKRWSYQQRDGRWGDAIMHTYDVITIELN
jgi:hypothetical protein